MEQGLPRIGVDLKSESGPGALSGPDLLELAREAERLGFDSVWLNEDVGRDATTLLSAMAMVTSSIDLGTAIVNVYSRSALQVAMAAATVDELSGGRAVLGLSVGHHPWNDLGHGIPLEAPLARLREYVAFIRKALSGRPFTHDGRVFSGVNTRLGFQPLRSDLPIFVGGEGPRMIALAGGVADGLLMNVVGPEYIANFAAEHFHGAARRAGRDPDALELMAIVTCCLADNAAEALEQARGMLLSRLRGNLDKRLATLPRELHAEVVALRAMVDRGEAEQARREASAALVRSLVVAGTAADVWRGIERYFAAGCTRVALASWPRDKAHVQRLLQSLALSRSAANRA